MSLVSKYREDKTLIKTTNWTIVRRTLLLKLIGGYIGAFRNDMCVGATNTFSTRACWFRVYVPNDSKCGMWKWEVYSHSPN